MSVKEGEIKKIRKEKQILQCVKELKNRPGDRYKNGYMNEETNR